MWWFAKLRDIGTIKGKVPTGVTVGVLRLLKHGNVGGAVGGAGKAVWEGGGV